jgi:hypothetical protein
MNATAFPLQGSLLETRTAERTIQRAVGVFWLSLSVAALVLGMVLVVFAYYREQPIFWRYAGGYPIWLRELVLLTFYPLLILETSGLLLLTRSLFSSWRGSVRSWTLHLSLISACWLLLVAVLGMAWANNLENLWEGRPVHLHVAD